MYATITNILRDSQLKPAGNSLVGEELTVGGTVVQIAATTLASPTSHVEISVKTNDVLVTIDGTAPVAAGAGMLLPKGAAPIIRSVAWASAAKFINAAGGSAAVVRIEPMAE